MQLKAAIRILTSCVTAALGIWNGCSKRQLKIPKTRVTAALGMDTAEDSYKNTFKFFVTAALGIRYGCNRRQL